MSQAAPAQDSQRDQTAVSLTAYVVQRSELSRLRVAGMGLMQRWRASLARIGAEVVEVAPGDLGQVLTRTDRPVLVADGGAVVEQAVVDLFEQAAVADAEALVPAAEGVPMAPVAMLGPEAARQLGATAPGQWDTTAELWQRLEQAPEVALRTLQVSDPFWRRVRSARDARSASWRMLRRLRLRPGGLAARHVNRHVSTAISYVLLKTPVTPNALTVFTLISGIVSAWVMSLGGYWAALGGAALMQFSSIVDGCDGEVARLRYLQSERGAWFDSIADEIVNALFLVAVGYNLYVTWGHWPWLALGILSGTVSFTYACFHWHSKYRYGIGMYWWFDQQKFDQGTTKQEVWESKSLMRYLKMLLWRDSFLLAYLLAAASWYLLPALLVVSGGGAAATAVMLFVHIVIKRARW